MNTGQGEEKSFFNLQLVSSLVFLFLLAVILTAFFIFAQWQSYFSQAEIFRKNYIDIQYRILETELAREHRLIDALVQKGEFNPQAQAQFLSRLREIRFGPEHNGYYFVLKLNKIDGGHDFARHLLLPLNPAEEGVPMDSDYVDSHGNPYRQIYLKQLKKTGHAKVAYWYLKPGVNYESQKVSVLVWVKSVDWVLGVGLYTDDLDRVLSAQKSDLREAFQYQVLISLLITLSILILGAGVSWFVQRRLKQRFYRLKRQNEQYQQQLEVFNLDLSQMVAQKTLALEQLYQFDALTGLYNRNKLLLDLQQQQEIELSPAALVLLNVDNFKEINDVFGFEVGDQLLISLAGVLKNYLPNTDRSYRVGGDEFVVWFDEAPQDMYTCLADLHQQLLQLLDDEPLLRDIQFNVTLVAALQVATPINALEMVMAKAKENHKNILVYSAEIDQKQDYQNNLKVTQLLKQAIKHNQVLPYYQPIVNCQTGRVEKYECLIRINTPEGILTPNQFLGVAKKSKLYSPLIKMMFEKCFAVINASSYTFSLNVSYEDLVDNEILDTLDQLITTENAPRVVFEILETEGIKNYEIVSHFIHKMKAQGCSVAIDDYGVGYSNLEHLLKLGVDVIKIDGSFVQSLPAPHAMAIIQSVVLFAQKLQLKTVAEFVSDEALFNLVKSIGIDFAQGYYFAEPQPHLQSIP